MQATQLYGLPSRIRVDKGGENTEICSIMEQLRGTDRGSAIRGTSVHNQRIERSWVDMWNGVTNVYHDLFHFLENRGSLDVDNSSHIWGLHYMFLPRISRDLRLYVTQWNNHGLRTERHASPLRLFVQRSLELSLRNILPVQDALGQPIDDLVESHWDDHVQVQVPRIQCPLDDEHHLDLKELVDPLDDTLDDLGLNNYLRVLEYVNTHQIDEEL